jgi:hypothetical protein
MEKVSCHVMSCHVMSRHVMSCHVMYTRALFPSTRLNKTKGSLSGAQCHGSSLVPMRRLTFSCGGDHLALFYLYMPAHPLVGIEKRLSCTAAWTGDQGGRGIKTPVHLIARAGIVNTISSLKGKRPAPKCQSHRRSRYRRIKIYATATAV